MSDYRGRRVLGRAVMRRVLAITLATTIATIIATGASATEPGVSAKVRQFALLHQMYTGRDAMIEAGNDGQRLTPTPLTALPHKGHRAFDGVLRLALSEDSDKALFGRIRLDIDFATNAVSGKVWGVLSGPSEEKMDDGAAPVAPTGRLKLFGGCLGEKGCRISGLPRNQGFVGLEGKLTLGQDEIVFRTVYLRFQLLGPVQDWYAWGRHSTLGAIVLNGRPADARTRFTAGASSQ